MLLRWNSPSNSQLEDYSRQQATLPYSYEHVGQTAKEFPNGFQHDRTSFELSKSSACWPKAKAALLSWQQFDNGWSQVFPKTPSLATDQVIVVSFRIYSFWWINACRIVYIIDEEDRFGFAYGTLPGHAEMGEEYFGIYRKQDGSVHFEINAFSRPRHWLVRLGKPLARYWQRKFVQQAGLIMQNLVSDEIT